MSSLQLLRAMENMVSTPPALCSSFSFEMPGDGIEVPQVGLWPRQGVSFSMWVRLEHPTREAKTASVTGKLNILRVVGSDGHGLEVFMHNSSLALRTWEVGAKQQVCVCRYMYVCM